MRYVTRLWFLSAAVLGLSACGGRAEFVAGAAGSSGSGSAGSAGAGFAGTGSGGTGSGGTASGGAGSGSAGSGTVIPPEPPGECVVAARIGCCDQPVPVRRSELDSDPCLLPWSHRHSVPAEVRSECAARAPVNCALVDCAVLFAFSRVAALGADGTCVFVDECQSDLDCDAAQDASRLCSCPVPYPISVIEDEGCLYSEIDHTIEDCNSASCNGDCPACAPCDPFPPVRCELGPSGLRVCGPPLDGF